MKLAILLVVIAILLAVTNPTQSDFAQWASAEVGEESDTALGEILSNVLGVPVADLSTDRSNYVFFSLYTVDVPGEESIMVLGILEQFIHVSSTRLVDVTS